MHTSANRHKKIWPHGFRPCRARRGQTFVYLRNSFFVTPLFGHRPAAHMLVA